MDTTSNVTDTGTREHLPTIVMLYLFVPIGITGNFLIIYVYGFRFKESTTRVFILTLAIFDVITCILLPYKIFLLQNPSFFINPHLARFEVVRIFFLQNSFTTLPLVAIDRYRRICKPFKKQISPQLAKILVVAVAGFMVLPIILRMTLTKENQHAYRPEVFISPTFMKKVATRLEIVVFYFITITIPFCVPLPIIVTLYVLIGLKVRRMMRREGNHPSLKESVVEGSSRSAEEEKTTDDETEEQNGILGKVTLKRSNGEDDIDEGEIIISRISLQTSKKTKHPLDESFDLEMTMDDNAFEELSSELRSPSNGNAKGNIIPRGKNVYVARTPDDRGLKTTQFNRDRELSTTSVNTIGADGPNEEGLLERFRQPTLRWKRMTTIFFLIAITNCISIVPFLTFFVIFRKDVSHGKKILSNETWVLLYNFTYISNVSNCFLYGFFDSRFRRKLKRFRCCCK